MVQSNAAWWGVAPERNRAHAQKPSTSINNLPIPSAPQTPNPTRTSAKKSVSLSIESAVSNIAYVPY
jgi:hypothetical protein